jgi:SAM-dependent methyltransferase
MYILDRDWVQNFINKGKVLDVGCSGGFFLEKFSPENWDRNGIEITKDAADFARNRLNIPVYTGKISDLDIPNDFDLIMLRGVIEHFSDPIGCLKKCAESLKKGGYLFITATPAGNSFSFYIYREKWRLFTPLEHIHYFSVDHLTKILEPIGFTLTARHYPYEETPYANPERDFIKMEKDIFYKFSGKWDQVESSSAFPGSMITAIWRKN